MQHLQSLPWASPLEYAQGLKESHFVLLYSSVQASYSGRYSLLAFDLAEEVKSHDFKTLEPKLEHSKQKYENAWFGYLGYGLKNDLEELPFDKPHWSAMPPLNFMRYHTILEFDHETRQLNCFSTHQNPVLPQITCTPPPALPAVKGQLGSNMTDQTYLEHVQTLIDRIHAGELYQANLTRKFYGQFTSAPEPLAVFSKLCAISPAAYSAFFKIGDMGIISSSPELFLKIHQSGKIETRPIKGTSPRFEDSQKDTLSKTTLSHSEKDRAENLMIVDLIRNDLSRSCINGSIVTEKLFEITSHSNVHHMSSTITGQKKPDCTALQVIAQAFPPGSMTGAPKIKAMHVLTELEQDDRNIYSGALGWLGGDGSAELSVVIRTILIKEDFFEFQIGGGIVADSTPQGEFQEVLDKASGIAKTLGLLSTQAS